MSHPTYEINTVSDMLAIPAERLDAFLADLRVHLTTVRALAENATSLAHDAGLPIRALERQQLIDRVRGLGDAVKIALTNLEGDKSYPETQRVLREALANA